MRILSVLGLWFVVQLAHADSLLLGGLGTHLGASRDEHNNWHRLIAYNHEQWVGAYFRNSYNEDTWMASYKMTENVDQFELGVMAGVMYGYRKCIIPPDTGSLDGKRRFCGTLNPYVAWNAHPNIQPVLINAANSFSISVRFKW